MKRIILSAIVYVACSLALFAASREDAVKTLLQDAGAATVFKLSDAQITRLQTALNSKMPVRKEYELYISKTGAVVIEQQMGKWGKINLAVLIDPVTKQIKGINIYDMQEKRGAGIKTSAFLNQFNGKNFTNIGDVGKGVRGVSGATVSSKAVVLSVKRALLVWEEYSAEKK